jgi:hypothetical protein
MSASQSILLNHGCVFTVLAPPLTLPSRLLTSTVQRPPVGDGAVARVADDFRREVFGGAAEGVGLAVVDVLGEAEVDFGGGIAWM